FVRVLPPVRAGMYASVLILRSFSRLVCCMYSSLAAFLFFFFSSRRRHTRLVSDWSSDVCSSDLASARSGPAVPGALHLPAQGPGGGCGAQPALPVGRYPASRAPAGSARTGHPGASSRTNSPRSQGGRSEERRVGKGGGEGGWRGA